MYVRVAIFQPSYHTLTLLNTLPISVHLVPNDENLVNTSFPEPCHFPVLDGNRANVNIFTKRNLNPLLHPKSY
jgi:hypothetical protein